MRSEPPTSDALAVRLLNNFMGCVVNRCGLSLMLEDMNVYSYTSVPDYSLEIV